MALLGVECHSPRQAEAPRPAVPTPHVAAPAVRKVDDALLPRPYPIPPQQKEPWTAPAGLDRRVADAVAEVFALGAADPRGLDYREVELEVGDVWSGARSVVKTHAWVMPKRGDDAFAIAWSGIVYRAKSIGAPADLRADVDAVLLEESRRLAQEKKQNPGWEPHRFDHATPEAANVSHTVLAPMRVAMLARFGQADLAKRVWSAWSGDKPPQQGDPANPPKLASLFIRNWAWAHFDRAVNAHMGGADDVALESTRTLLAVKLDPDDEGKWPVPELHADTVRRLTSKKVSTKTLEEIVALPVAERVPLLVDRLDEVAARQWGQPGGVALGMDPIVAALIAVGNDAVDPLIDAIETDTRLTRSVHFWRDFARSRSLLGVHEAAYVALSGIVEMSFFQPASTGDDLSSRGPEMRKKLATELRAYWKQWRGVPMEEKWYRILADDKATHAQWQSAAASIVQPTNVTVVPGSMVFTTTTTTSGGPPPALRGESLRAKSSPTVTDLLKRRVADMKDEPQAACEVAIALGTWDGRAATATLAAQMKTAIAGTDHSRFSCIARLTSARASAGDASALAEYAQWMGTTSPRTQDIYGLENALGPMKEFPADPQIEAAAKKMFGPGGAWVPLVPTKKIESGASFQLPRLLQTDLLRVKPFREHVLAALTDRTKAGKLSVFEGGSIKIDMIAGWQTGTSVMQGDHPSLGTIAVRVADYYASELSSRQGAPPFRLYWPEAERDRGIAAMRAYVEAVR